MARVSPTTIIASTGFKASPPPSQKTSNIFADFFSALILAVFPTLQTGLANGASEVATLSRWKYSRISVLA